MKTAMNHHRQLAYTHTHLVYPQLAPPPPPQTHTTGLSIACPHTSSLSIACPHTHTHTQSIHSSTHTQTHLVYPQLAHDDIMDCGGHFGPSVMTLTTIYDHMAAAKGIADEILASKLRGYSILLPEDPVLVLHMHGKHWGMMAHLVSKCISVHMCVVNRRNYKLDNCTKYRSLLHVQSVKYSNLLYAQEYTSVHLLSKNPITTLRIRPTVILKRF